MEKVLQSKYLQVCPETYFQDIGVSPGPGQIYLFEKAKNPKWRQDNLQYQMRKTQNAI
jgi:hypothetical protein